MNCITIILVAICIIFVISLLVKVFFDAQARLRKIHTENQKKKRDFLIYKNVLIQILIERCKGVASSKGYDADNYVWSLELMYPSEDIFILGEKTGETPIILSTPFNNRGFARTILRAIKSVKRQNRKALGARSLKHTTKAKNVISIIKQMADKMEITSVDSIRKTTEAMMGKIQRENAILEFLRRCLIREQALMHNTKESYIIYDEAICSETQIAIIVKTSGKEMRYWFTVKDKASKKLTIERLKEKMQYIETDKLEDFLDEYQVEFVPVD